MKIINKILAIIPYDFNITQADIFGESNYKEKLNTLLENITILNWIDKQFKLKIEQRDFIIKFKKFTDKEMTDFNHSIFEKDNVGHWHNFIYSLSSKKSIVLKPDQTASFTDNSYHFGKEQENNLLLANDYNFKKSLFIFWRLIANNLNSNTTFKIGFKVLFKLPLDKDNKLSPKEKFYNKPIIRTISSIQIVKNTDFNDLYKIFVKHIEAISETYVDLDLISIIFPFYINKEDSILKDKILVEPEINDILSEENIKWIKNNLKSGVKNFPTNVNLFKWGELKVINGTYPYNVKDLLNNITIKILITVKNKANNYVVFIKGINHNGKNYILHKVSVVNKKFEKPIFEFIDIIEDTGKKINLNNFTRLIKNQLIVYNNNEVVYNQNRHSTPYFTKIKKCEGIFNKFITMDLETKNINGNLEPYCICIFDGKKSYSFYITDYTSSDSMLKSALNFLMKSKYNKHIVYLHNFSYFDGIFLFKSLVDLIQSKNIKPLIRNGRIINLKVEWTVKNKNENKKDTKYCINFRDSYLLLTASLSKLGKTFSSDKITKEEKWFFPFNFVNEEHVNYDYVGNVPDIKYFEGMDDKTYNNYLEFTKNKNKSLNIWNLKEETIYYCNQDCKTLYNVIKEFSKLIFKQFNISISKTPTISSLAFRIFRSSFIDDNNKIAVINNEIYEFLYRGFYGGAVDAYIPIGENIKDYDVNSLYPTAMFNNPMPVGNPYYFEGDIKYFKIYAFPTEDFLDLGNKKRNNRSIADQPENIIINEKENKYKSIFDYVINIFNIDNYSEFKTKIISFLNLENNNGLLCNENNLPYGFFEVELETPPKEEWNEPILLKRHKTKFGGHRTIAPVGKWNGVYFSEELYNAVNKNSKHKFKVKCGFLFRNAFIFKDYVEKLYKLKQDSNKNSPLYAIAKLLLNSLYGRFGMKPTIEQHIIYDPLNSDLDLNDLHENNKVDILAVFGDKELLSIKKNRHNSELVNLIDDNLSNKSNLFINVSISSAITGLSRIFMSYFKNNPLFKLYYSDTDSAFIDIDLETIDKNLLGPNLGQLKLETTFKKALFLAPKVYGGITSDGKSIVKAKGVKNLIPYQDLEPLLHKGIKLKMSSEKWYRNLGEGNIQIKQEIYNLAINSTKRELIYDDKDVLITTKPLEINED